MNLTSLRRAGAFAATLALASGTLAMTTTSAHAAGPTGIVSGTALQPGGSALPGVSMTLSQGDDTDDEADDVSRQIYVQDNGTFDAAVPAGTYTVSAYDRCDVYAPAAPFSVTVTAGTEQSFNVPFTTANPASTDICQRVTPKIVGLPQVGVPLRITPGTYANPVTGMSYQWYSDSESNPIPGATGLVYVPTGNDIGAVVYAIATVTSATESRTYEAYNEDNYDDVKRGDYVFKTGPQVVNLPILGKTVSASAGKLVPGATLSYQWFRDGKAIPGQTARTHRVSKADYQKRLSAVITYKTYGYATVVRTVKAAFDAKKKAKASAKVSTGKKSATFTVKVSPSASNRLKGKVSILEDGKTLKRVSIKSGTVTVKLTNLKSGKHSFKVVYQGKKYAAGTSKTVRIKK